MTSTILLGISWLKNNISKTVYSHAVSDDGYKDKKQLLDFYNRLPLTKTSITSIFQLKSEFC
ncbi:hypothetical protein RO3G_10574 [Rhizopus delemar RA 99-880]|uniref:Uncharacterized protein n=1 Tax=Rhizopus delemar (strain RA 99-880 / ATCC MYA-4621 / FGSC 9543 / NRRL 43880) TaxID=246409 RepID=I1CBN4_RHIO9|nr:hypothetical protein RO3G_10574 [Rhizopus delemar RA 99-880]|eukprot:EIE85864.1 hypothetical protein RO3G_10574 [Rhizopus delemar RA 99-880]